MTDIAGKEIHINDIVVCTSHYYKELAIGKVIKITPKRVQIIELTNGFNYYKDYTQIFVIKDASDIEKYQKEFADINKRNKSNMVMSEIL